MAKTKKSKKLHGVRVTVFISEADLESGWKGKPAAFAESVAANLQAVAGKDGKSYAPEVTHIRSED